MISVELIYDTDCPNLEGARTNLLHAFHSAGIPPTWKEWDRSAHESPSHARSYGSPTILINGRDVADASPLQDADCCRIYPDKNGRLRGAPAVELITAALFQEKDAMPLTRFNSNQQGNWRGNLAVLPGIGFAMVPKLACPACWPAYAGILGSLGFGFVNYTTYLLPLTVVFLTIAVVSLGYRARNRRGYKPFVLGFFAAAIVIVGKFIFISDQAMFGGIALLMGASLWNSWPKKRSNTSSCSACA